MDTRVLKRVIEAALLSATEPMAESLLTRLFEGDYALEAAELTAILSELQADWQDKGVELVKVSGGWRFQTRPDIKPYLDRLNPEKTPRYSRSVLETLAIIAYKQPVTRGDIEAIRGVTVASTIIKALEERGWVESIGHRDAPGRPALFATTKQFLDDMGLKTLSDLPPLMQPDSNDNATQNLFDEAMLNAAQTAIEQGEAPNVAADKPSDAEPNTAPDVEPKIAPNNEPTL